MTDNWLKEVKKKAENIRYDVPEEMFDSIWGNVSLKRALRRRMGAIFAAAAASAAVMALVLTIHPKEEMNIAGHEEKLLTAEAGVFRLEEESSVAEPRKENKNIGRAPDTKIAVNRQPEQPIETDNPTHVRDNYVNKDETSPRADADRQTDKDYLAQIPEPEKSRETRKRIHLSFSGTTPGTNQEMAGIVSQRQIQSLIQKGDNPNISSTNGFGLTEEESREYCHRMPIEARIILSAGIADRLSVEGGLSYSFHNSVLTGSTVQYYQQLHFIGIPMGVRYDFLRYGQATVYARAGGVAEKCISGHISGEGGQNKVKIKIDPLFWSAEASLGAQVDIIGPLYLFAEGGASYHFANSTGNLTYYGSHPLMFSLQAGARIEIF